VAVSPAGGEATAAVCGMLGVPFTCLGDPSGKAYDAFGLGRAGLSQMVSLRILWQSVRSLVRGNRPSRPQGDISRLPGAFVIDRGGVVRWARRGHDAADHAGAAELLVALDKLGPPGPG